MSNSAINWAIAQKASPRNKLVMFVLGNRAKLRPGNRNETCWMKVATIAKETGLSERAVQAAITSLIREGKIFAERRGGRRQPSIYHLIMGAADAPYSDGNGAADAPYEEVERVQDSTERVQSTTERVQDSTQKGAAPAPRTLSNHQEPSSNPEGADEFAGPSDDVVSLTPPPENRPASSPKVKGRERRGCRLPDGWRPSPAGMDFARSVGLDPDAALAEFWDYWRAAVDGTKLDWEATWRNSCRMYARRGQSHTTNRNLPLFGSIPGGKPPSHPPDPADPWGIQAWCAASGFKPTVSENDRALGKWIAHGVVIDSAAEDVAGAAGLPPEWRGDWSPLLAWAADDLVTDRTFQVIADRARSAVQPVRSLRYFEMAVRGQRRPWGYTGPAQRGAKPETEDPWGIQAWCRSQGFEPTTHDEDRPKGKWVAHGVIIDAAAEKIARAARFPPDWRGDWSPILPWAADDLLGAEAYSVIADRAQGAAQPVRSLKYFDMAVRGRRRAA